MANIVTVDVKCLYNDQVDMCEISWKYLEDYVDYE